MKKVSFRGGTVTAGWPEKLKAAQKETEIKIGGSIYKRLTFGQEGSNWGSKCHDCAAIHGEYHVSGCDVERCPKCGGQLISCGC